MIIICFMLILNLPGIYLRLHIVKHKINIKSDSYVEETPKLINFYH